MLKITIPASRHKKDTARVSFLFLWWSIFNESRTVITNHARGVYIIRNLLRYIIKA